MLNLTLDLVLSQEESVKPNPGPGPESVKPNPGVGPESVKTNPGLGPESGGGLSGEH